MDDGQRDNLQLEMPTELVQEIFHYGAQLSTPFCLTLCQVSTWARDLALSHLYSTVILKNHIAEAQFLASLQRAPFSTAHKSDFKPRSAVRNLRVEPISNLVVSIFEICDKVTHLAVPLDNLIWLVHVLRGTYKLSKKAVERKPDLDVLIADPINSSGLSMTRYVLTQNPEWTSSMFSKITRLRVEHISGSTSLDIAHFTRLTHLAIPFFYHSYSLSVLDDIIQHPSLEVLIIVVLINQVQDVDRSKLERWLQEKNRTERMLKISLLQSTSNIIRDGWEEEVRGGRSIWAATTT